ncbi:MAG TPA: hypothetical protein VJ570_13095 [Holophagaceae bacterium]|nr:hypothetical protein [Holophagaceae bacterium]
MSIAFDLDAERARYAARQPFLARHWAMALELAPGVRFQPETEASVEDQVRETFWSEGNDPDQASARELAEMRVSFGALAPRTEAEGISLVATLFLGFPEAVREARMAALAQLPERLRLVLDDGSEVTPAVDRGYTGASQRLPAVLALRYLVPDGRRPVALVSLEPEVPGFFPGPAGWSDWLPASR